MFYMREIQAQIKLVLVVLRLHMGTQLVERLVVVLLSQMGQLMHNDHAQKLVGHLLEHRGDTNLMFGRQPVALHTRHGGM
ncbi:hypothetical protein D3C71_1396260 [compost metagenome]